MLACSAGEVSEDTVRKVRETYDRLYAEDPLKLVKPYPGIPALLRLLHSHQIKLAVLSNKPDDMTCRVVEGLFGTGLFSHVQGQKEGVPKKPDPTAPRFILETLGAAPEKCLYIGDSGVDMETGKNASMTTVGATWGFRSREELLAHGACHLADSPEQIAQLVLGTNG